MSQNDSGNNGDGVEYTPLQEFSARLSGELALDATADEGLGVARIHASEAALRANESRLEEQGYNTELYLKGVLEDERPTLDVHPRPGDLDPIDLTRRSAEVLLEAGDCFCEDIVNGRLYGKDRETSDENLGELGRALTELRARLNDGTGDDRSVSTEPLPDDLAPDVTGVYAHRDPTTDSGISDFVFVSFGGAAVEGLEAPWTSVHEWVEANVMRLFDNENDALDRLLTAESEREEEPPRVGRLFFDQDAGEVVALELDPEAFSDE